MYMYNIYPHGILKINSLTTITEHVITFSVVLYNSSLLTINREKIHTASFYITPQSPPFLLLRRAFIRNIPDMLYLAERKGKVHNNFKHFLF